MESSAAVGIADVGDPNPATLELFSGEVRDMLDGLGDELLCQIAMLKLEGYTNPEVRVARPIRVPRLAWIVFRYAGFIPAGR